MIDAKMIDPTDIPVEAELGPLPRLHLTRTLVLVGLMGSGKTSVGKRLAAQLAVPFTDSDNEIVAAAGMSIPEIFSTLGEPAFRDGERRVIARLLTEPPRILATGGGAFIDASTREAIAAGSISVWIRASLDLLWDRVRDRPGRPLLATANPRQVLGELLERRYPVYGQADIVVDSRRGSSQDAMARVILDAVRAHDAAHPDHPPALEAMP